MQLLHIDSSISGSRSVSRMLTAVMVQQWRAAVPSIEVVYRDLAVATVPHATLNSLPTRTEESQVTDPAQRQDRALTEILLKEFLAAEAIVIGAPMYNFSVPTQLKAWIDRIVQAGHTFRYTEHGPVGLAGNKKVVIVSARGGAYGNQEPSESVDFQERYLISIFRFMGIRDPRLVRAEGMALDQEQRDEALRVAHETIRSISHSMTQAV